MAHFFEWLNANARIRVTTLQKDVNAAMIHSCETGTQTKMIADSSRNIIREEKNDEMVVSEKVKEEKRTFRIKSSSTVK